jgi:hypothetical protein
LEAKGSQLSVLGYTWQQKISQPNHFLMKYDASDEAAFETALHIAA